MQEYVPTAPFGWDPLWVSTIVLILSYAVIISERVNRVVAALLGAGIMGALGILNQHESIKGVDFNTLSLLIGMMAIVGITRQSGVFQYVAIWTAKKVRGEPRLLLAALFAVTAVFSALLDNVTTVMLVVPVTIALTQRLRIPLYPFLFSQIFASNIGGTATLIGDPPNIMIGSAAKLSFMDFVYNVGPPSVLAAVLAAVFFDFFWGRKMSADQKAQQAVLAMNENEAIEDRVLLWKSLCVIALAIAGFIVGHQYGFEPGSVALVAAAFLMLLDGLGHEPEKQGHKVHAALSTVEWQTIFFFIGLFIIVHGVEVTGLLKIMAQGVLDVTGGDLRMTGMLVLWSSAILSAVIDNIPFVATMIPMIKAMSADLGGDQALLPLWWCLSLGACLGGNGTLVGASANVVVAGLSERAGERISFVGFMKLAFPLMLASIAVATVYAWFVYF